MLSATSYRRVIKKATRNHDKFFIVLCHNKGDMPPQLGMAISRKNCRTAITRNRIKRIIREVFRHYQAQLTGLDIVVINKPAAALARNNVIAESVKGHFKKCSSIKQKIIKQES